jgi:hypothetical protein
MRWKGSAMLRRSPRRTLKAIITQAVALVVALAGSDLKRSVTKQAQSKSIELPGSRHDYEDDRRSFTVSRESAVCTEPKWSSRLQNRPCHSQTLIERKRSCRHRSTKSRYSLTASTFTPPQGRSASRLISNGSYASSNREAICVSHRAVTRSSSR